MSLDSGQCAFSAFVFLAESHGTINTFKNYFTVVFSVISFQFSVNKQYPNTPSHDNYFTLDKKKFKKKKTYKNVKLILVTQRVVHKR